MHKTYALLTIMLVCPLPATEIFIKNWGIFPVSVSEAVVPEAEGDKTLKTAITVQPGQSMPIKIHEGALAYANFNRLTVKFNVNGYFKTEDVFFPDEHTQEASLAFSESGYKRFPYSIAKNNK